MVARRRSSSYFFFFKQKTAYEMRISDWSSDVCSSDLRGRAAVAGVHRDRRADGQPDVLVSGRESPDLRGVGLFAANQKPSGRSPDYVRTTSSPLPPTATARRDSPRQGPATQPPPDRSNAAQFPAPARWPSRPLSDFPGPQSRAGAGVRRVVGRARDSSPPQAQH